MPEISNGLIGDFPYSIWEHDSSKHLCGYLGIPPKHPWYHQHYDKIFADIHGGLSYSDNSETYPSITKEVYGLNIWWIGFDCAHAGDWPLFNNGHKWTRDEVYDELIGLAEQAYAAQEQLQTSNYPE